MLKIMSYSYLNRLIRNSKCYFTKNTSKRYSTIQSTASKVHVLPALQDNYMYVLIDSSTQTAAAIDPVEPDKIINLVEREKVNLTSILTTHHHLDHCGGNRFLLEKMRKELQIYGGDDRVDCMNCKISHGDVIKLGSLTIKCLLTPCHTSRHICYYVECHNDIPFCFTGDTLFVAGCGRFFEGTAEDMLNSMKILADLPGHTKIYCGHEYTLSNLRFAQHVEPDNVAIRDKLLWAIAKRKNMEPTVPSSIHDELTFNPFMRIEEKSVQKFTKQEDPVLVMQKLRKSKDSFK